MKRGRIVDIYPLSRLRCFVYSSKKMTVEGASNTRRIMMNEEYFGECFASGHTGAGSGMVVISGRVSAERNNHI